MTQISLTFLDNPTFQDSLRVVKKIGQGKFPVFHAYSASRQANYALKVFPADRKGTYLYRKEKKLAKFDHQNIIHRIPVTCHHTDFHAFVIELARYGDFFDALGNGLFNSNRMIIRTYFQQLIAGVEHMHSQGVAHLDLKLENLMLGDNFQLKIIDFDSSQLTSDPMITSLGSRCFRAPEIIGGNGTNFSAADVYSMGVILYTLKAGEMPFLEMKEEETQGLNCLVKFVTDRSAFWNDKKERFGAGYFSEEFIELINGMLDFDVEKRWTIEDIKASKWYNEPALDVQELESRMKTKWKEVKAKKEKAMNIENSAF